MNVLAQMVVWVKPRRDVFPAPDKVQLVAQVGEVLSLLIEVMEKREFEAFLRQFVEEFQTAILQQHSVHRSPLLDRHDSHLEYFFAKESCIAIISCLDKHSKTLYD